MSLRVKSYRQVRDVLFHPEIKEHLIPGFDGVPIGDEYYYLRAGKGLMVFVDCGEMYEVHAALFRDDKGKKRLINDCIEWMKSNVGKKYMVARISQANKPARRMAAELGFELIDTGKQVTYGKYC
jgi:hypothetical protein